MTTNEHYGQLNARFEERSAALRALGFCYERLTAYNIALFVRTRRGKTVSIAAGLVLCADDIVWADQLHSAA